MFLFEIPITPMYPCQQVRSATHDSQPILAAPALLPAHAPFRPAGEPVAPAEEVRSTAAQDLRLHPPGPAGPLRALPVALPAGARRRRRSDPDPRLRHRRHVRLEENTSELQSH